MKRLVLLTLLAAVLVAATGSAAHAAAVGRATGQSRASVVGYWTQARILGAVPAERAGKPTGGKPGGSIATYPFTALTPAQPDTSYPTNTNGKVYFTEGRTNYVCSGTALASANRSVVWTAGHCVNAGPGKFHTNWMFVPAYSNGATPFGKFTASKLLSTSGWQDSGDFRYDLGAAVVSTSSTTGKTLTDALEGGRKLSATSSILASYTLWGYPQAKPFNGQTLRGCAAPFGLFDPYSQAPAPIGVGCNMTGGSSGGAWLNQDGEVVSVNSYGYTQMKNVMFGPQQGSEAAALLAAAEK